MARRRFLADEVHGDTAVLKGQNATHLARVLRAKVGQEYEIAADGVVRLGTVSSIGDNRVEFKLGAAIQSSVVNRPFPTEGKDRAPTTLVVAVFKFDRFEWAVEKATELGVARILPVIARRTDAHLAQAAQKRVERWRRIAHEASQQSRRKSPPEICEPVKLKDAVTNHSGLKVLLAEAEQHRTLRSVLEEVDGRSVTLAVGPEGGWTEDEVLLFEKENWISATLGPTILRAETAVIASLAIVVSSTDHTNH